MIYKDGVDLQECKENNKRIVLFLALTLGVTYFVEFFVIMPMVGSTDMEQAAAAQSMISGIMFLPAVAALLTRVLTGDKLTLKNMMLAVRVKQNLRYFGLVWFGFGLLILLGAALYFLFFREQFDPDMGYARVLFETQAQAAGQKMQMSVQEIRNAVLFQILLTFVLSPFANLLSCFGEEWGFRGYLLPKLLKTYRVVPAILASGIFWGLWYLPLVVMGYDYGIGYPGFPVAGILLMCLYCTAVGTALSYVTIRTGSCIPAIMGHGMLNGFAMSGIYFTSLEHPYHVLLGPVTTGLVGMIPFLALAGYLLVKLRREEQQGG